MPMASAFFNPFSQSGTGVVLDSLWWFFTLREQRVTEDS
jgi:hypothetical protein